MKLIHCDLCNDVKKLNYRLEGCQCGNIAGRYLEDGRTAEIHLKNEDAFKNSRVLGFPNQVRYGKLRESTCWYFNWYDKWIHVYCNGKRQIIIKSGYVNDETLKYLTANL